MFFDNPMKPPHDRGVPSLRRSLLVNGAMAKALRHGFDQRLLESARHLGVRENRGCVFRQSRGGRVQPLQSRHRFR
jgi:hypothetical protein